MPPTGDINVTHIPDEAVQDAVKAYSKQMDYNDNHDDAVKAALTAAIPNLPLGYEVKKLEWEHNDRPNRMYQTSDERGSIYYIDQSFGSDSYYFTTIRCGDGAVLYDGDDLPAAKSAAQADFERRILSFVVTKPVDVVEADVSMTEEEIRLENLKQMAMYDGAIVSFECREPYYLASCDHCGWVGSSELCGTDSFGDDSDVYCPRCHSSGADCGEVAERINCQPVDVAAVRRQAFEDACNVIDGYSEYDQPYCCSGHMCGCYGATVHQHMQHFIRALSSEPARGEQPQSITSARPLEDWHEDYGDVVWWAWDDNKKEWFGEAPFISHPLSSDWPDYHTHWTPLPNRPAAPTAEAGR